MEVGRVGEEGPLHFLVLLLWEELEAGLCGLVGDGKRQRERERKKKQLVKKFIFFPARKTTRLLIRP